MRKVLAIISMAFLCVACGSLENTTTSKALYSWYNYENANYQYNKRKTDELRDKLLEQYKLIVENQKGTRAQVPPGLCAEYGYLLCQLDKKTEGLGFLKQEIKFYPESETYISRIIKQLEQ